jgi:all-trans-retinol 13,14-reductase
MSEKYDNVIVGAGAGGVAMALFLAQAGGKTLIIEKASSPGGALGSFYHKGYRLDAGFHFAGALQNGGIFDDILKMFGIRDKINPIFLDKNTANKFHFTKSGKTVNFPYGLERLKKSLKEQFKTETTAIDKYFSDIDSIVRRTPTLRLETLHLTPEIIPEDSITFQSYLKSITDNPLLRESLNALVMCHGSAPSEISLADNARLCQGFYESICTLEDGGSSLVNAFLDELKKYNVEIICSDEIVELADIKEKKVGRLILKSGREIEPGVTVFTINPQSVIDLLPKNSFPPAFFKRVENFESTPGFFTVFASLDNKVHPEDVGSITSLYPIDDIDTLSLPGWHKPGALAIMHSKSGKENIVTAFEPIYWDRVSQWSDSAIASRPPEYYEWKNKKTEEILNRISSCFPSYKNKLNHITSATPLTYRDYLNHYNGAAYGIKQKINQFNLIGQLRVRNIFVAGQSAILPGVLGTIMASLLVAKNIIGPEKFIQQIQQQKKNS